MKILITAGPTREYIDDVRFLSNGSSGKMGYSIADECLKKGHAVKLISGPVQLSAPEGVDLVRVVSAEEMFAAVKENLRWCEVLVMCAAVADFKPADGVAGKIKKSSMPLDLKLQPNPDILKGISDQKEDRVFVGFAAESGDPVDSARIKLSEKNLDMIVANDVSRPDAGFEVDTNKIVIIDNKGLVKDLPVMSKRDAAVEIVDWIDSCRD